MIHSYDANIRREGAADSPPQALWLVEVQLTGVRMEPWWLVIERPVTNADSALRIFRMCRQRWGVEDAFKFTEECLGWEDAQVLDLTGIRTLVALSRVTDRFLHELGGTVAWPEVQLVAQLGG